MFWGSFSIFEGGERNGGYLLELKDFSLLKWLEVAEILNLGVMEKNSGPIVIVQSSYQMGHTKLWLYCETYSTNKAGSEASDVLHIQASEEVESN